MVNFWEALKLMLAPLRLGSCENFSWPHCLLTLHLFFDFLDYLISIFEQHVS